ncbi:TPA: hypothetical protein MH649_16225 [Klebsiella pneumoniae]|nr:hypothetical protein [Klebsiella pneumoniae]HBX6229986.1 hypothetical protein [Klebsiella pneumoniae]HBY6584492.1 hypothetical protein [Klebsiella pneumoniae]
MALTLKPQRKCINNLFLKRAVSARNALSPERVKPPGLFFSAIGIALGNSGSGNAFLSLYIDFMITMLMNYCFLLLIKSQF